MGAPPGEAPGGSRAAAAAAAEADANAEIAGKLAKWRSGCAARAPQHWLWLTFQDRALEARFRGFHADQLAKARCMLLGF